MTVKELKDVLNLMDNDSDVKICVNEPAGWICPDGATVDIKGVYMGIDWHQGQVLIVPKHKLDIHDVEEWGKPVKEEDDELEHDKPQEDGKKEPLINGMPVDKYLRTLAKERTASEKSTLVFK